jgi:hypothetical protein
LYGSNYYTTVDCERVFWQVKLAEEGKTKTAFSTPSGQFQFQRLPFGLSNSPASFQCLLDVVLKELKGTECWIFLDDVIVYSDTIEEHARRLEHVLQRFEKVNLLLQPTKFLFAKSEVQYLGYVVSRDGIAASPDKVRAVKENPLPRNVKVLRPF